MNEVKHSTDARDAILKGIDLVADAVKVTLGPKGKVVMLDKHNAAPLITKDGVTVAKYINPENRFERMGANLIKEVAGKTNDQTGDGTTTATVLAQALIHEGLKEIKNGIDARRVCRDIEESTQRIITYVSEKSIPVKEDDIQRIASISANDEKIGELVAQAMKLAGGKGVVAVEESKTFETVVEKVEGMQFDRGYISPYMVTNHEKATAELVDPMILVTDQQIVSQAQLVPIMQKLVENGHKDLLIIADDVTGEALATCVVNMARGMFNAVAIRLPGFGDHKKDLTNDLCAVIGAKLISESNGSKLQTIQLEDLGRASKVTVSKDRTTIVGGAGAQEIITERLKLLEDEKQGTTSYQKEKIEERINKLLGGVVVIKVGGATETEIFELRDRVVDAVGASQAALEGGIVPGGGVVLLNAVKSDKYLPFFSAAMSEPFKWIAKNAGANADELLADGFTEGMGFNASTGGIGDMIKMGVIDPSKVTICALRNASSIAIMVLTTEAAVAELEPNKN